MNFRADGGGMQHYLEEQLENGTIMNSPMSVLRNGTIRSSCYRSMSLVSLDGLMVSSFLKPNREIMAVPMVV